MKMKTQFIKIWWDVAKTVLREKFVALNGYIKKEERSKINNLSFYLRKLEKEEQSNFKVSKREVIIRNRAKINETESRK